MIIRQDGSNKNACERNAAKRYMDDFHWEHPSLKSIVIEDSLSSNAPHIRELQRHDLRYIPGTKQDDHQYLFQTVDETVADMITTELQKDAPDKEGLHHCILFLTTTLP